MSVRVDENLLDLVYEFREVCICIYIGKSYYVMYKSYVKDNVVWILYEIIYIREIDVMLNLYMYLLYVFFIWNLYICKCVVVEE